MTPKKQNEAQRPTNAMNFFERFWFELNPGQFFDGWVSVFTIWYIFGFVSIATKLSKQAEENTFLRKFIEGSDASWVYVSFLFIPFLLYMLAVSFFRALS